MVKKTHSMSEEDDFSTDKFLKSTQDQLGSQDLDQIDMQSLNLSENNDDR